MKKSMFALLICSLLTGCNDYDTGRIVKVNYEGDSARYSVFYYVRWNYNTIHSHTNEAKSKRDVDVLDSIEAIHIKLIRESGQEFTKKTGK